VKIAVLGGSGYLGGRVALDLSQKYDVTTVTRRPFVLKNCSNLVVNFNEKFYNDLIGFDVIVNCIGGNRNDIEVNPKSAADLKQSLITNLCFLSEIKKIFLLHVSSKHVYSILKQNDTRNLYALSHLNTERILEEKFSTAIGSSYQVLRLANCFGVPATQSSEFSRLFLNQVIIGILKDNDDIRVRNPKIISSFVPLCVVSSYLKEIFLNPFLIEERILDLGMPYSFYLGDAEKIIRGIFSDSQQINNRLIINSLYGQNFIEKFPHYADISFFNSEVTAFKFKT